MNTFIQKCSSIHDCTSFLLYSPWHIQIDLHRPWLYFYQHLHLCEWLHFHLNDVFLPCIYLRCLCVHILLLPCVRLCCLCLHRLLLHSFSSFDSLMNIESTNVTPSPSCPFACQLFQRLRKNSTLDLLVLCISWINVCANCIFSFYALCFSHFEDDGECNNDLIAKDWIFSTPSYSAILNCSFASFFLNSSTSSSHLHLCSLFYVSFSFVIIYIF